MTKPLISIIIPCYNAEKYIAETIQSVINQTYNHWEIILVNDGSTDKSTEIAKTFKNNKISIINKKNTGVSDSRNIGIIHAKGNYIALLDADDYWLNNNLEKKLHTFLNNDCDYVFSDMYNADEKLNIIEMAPLGTDINILDNFLYWKGESEIIPGPCSNLIIKRKCIEDIEVRFEKSLSNYADHHFCVLLASKFKGKYINEPLLKYRILPNSMSRSLELLEKDSLLAYHLYKNIKVFKSKLFEKKCISNMYLILAGSWWVNGNNKIKGLKYIFYSLLTYPPVIFKIIKKI